VDTASNVYIADTQNNRVRKFSGGIITTLAGNGTRGFSGDSGPATSIQLFFPSGIAVDSAGNVYIADTGNNRIRRVSGGVVTTVAGSGPAGYPGSFGGDNGSATSAQLSNPFAIALDSAGNLYIADTGNNRIRRVSGGVITTVAGNGMNAYAPIGPGGFGGDGGSATSAQMNGPTGVAVDSAGNLYIADTGSNRIRRVSSGVITTVAGNGLAGFSGDGPAASVELFNPSGVAADSLGNLLISDSNNELVRKVSNGMIITIAGMRGTQVFGEDNGPATSAELNYPTGVAMDLAGNARPISGWI
jgi:sugar lactone lactonase YvrE